MAILLGGCNKKCRQGFALVQPTHLGVVQFRVRVDMVSIPKKGFDQQRKNRRKPFFFRMMNVYSNRKNHHQQSCFFIFGGKPSKSLIEFDSGFFVSFVFGKPLVGSTRCRMSRLNTHALFESLMKTSGGSLLLEKASQAAVENDETQQYP